MISAVKSKTSSWFEAYAALSTSIMILETATNRFVPENVRSLIFPIFKGFLSGFMASCVKITIFEFWENSRNELYDAVNEYLPSKISDSNKNLVAAKLLSRKEITVAVQNGEAVEDVFHNIKLRWRFCVEQDNSQPISTNNQTYVKRMYELTFSENDRNKVMNSYLPHVLSTYRDIKQRRTTMKIYNRSTTNGLWEASELKHPSTFDTLAIEPELKKCIIEDLDRFLRRKDFYKKVGKPWRRGYLLYGPPGTGKSSLIAAMANYLKFDVYNLELSSIWSDNDLMTLIRQTSNRSLIVLEDIDCNNEVHNRAGKGIFQWILVCVVFAVHTLGCTKCHGWFVIK